MKSVLNIIISVFVTAALLSSCSTDDKRQPVFEDFSEIDFGEGIYRPNPFKFLDELPPFSWMGMPDSVKMKTRLEVKFNDDAVRSKSASSFFFVDKAGMPISDITVNGIPAEDFIAKADTAPQWITISYCVNPAVGDSLLSGYLIADGTYLDESNGQQFSSGQATIASWQLNHKTGINWLRWLIFIIVIALILYALFIIGYLIFYAISACIEALPAVSTISISIPSFSFKHNMKKQRRENRKKADEDDEFTGYARKIAPTTYQINRKYIIPNGSQHKNPTSKNCGQLLDELKDPDGIIMVRPDGEPIFNKDGGTNSGKPLEAHFPEGIKKFLSEDDLRNNKPVKRNKLHDEAFRRIAKRYNMDETMLQVFKGNSAVVTDLKERWGCSEQEVYNRCKNPHRIARVLHECKDCKTVQLVPWVYHHISHEGGIESVKSNYK